jgi:hypothetical protein
METPHIDLKELRKLKEENFRERLLFPREICTMGEEDL